MKLPLLRSAAFLRRVNRFRAEVFIDGSYAAAHVPNSGRLTDLLRPYVPVYVHPATRPGRKTAYDLLLVQYTDQVLVSIDARLPPKLFAEALPTGLFDGWLRAPGDQWEVQTEPAHGEGRLDLYLSGPQNSAWWIETKSVTLVNRGVALFPDAPTARGRRHLADLCALAQRGQRAAVIFLVQRPDAESFAPHPEADPKFPAVLQQAADCGVAVHAYTCRVSLTHIEIEREIPVSLTPPRD